MEPSRQPVPYQPRRFKSAVPYYERFRLAYPERLITRVAALLRLAPGDAVLDLGAGPGLLAVPFAKLGLDVTAADPEPDMLDAAAAAAAAANVTLKLWQGGSYELTPDMGPYRLVTMGRSFHWMDRPATLAMLDRIIAPGGALALFHDAHPVLDDNRWFKTLRAVSDRFGRAQSAHMPERRQLGHRRYEPFLYASAFTELDWLSVTIRQSLSMDDVVGRAYSMSRCSPETLGDLAPAFETELRAALLDLSPDGVFTEIAELVSLVARRP